MLFHRELIQQGPESSLSPVVRYLTPVKAETPEINPDIKLLIDKELPEDSDDEEYSPENEDEQVNMMSMNTNLSKN